MNKYIFIFILFAGGLLLAWWIGYSGKIFSPQKTENATVMLEKVKLVTKLISVEGHFSELFEKKEWYEYDFFNLFSKKILIRVKAKVSVGYNFQSLNITVDSLSKTVTLNEFPQPEIISLDHDLDYYDVQEGTFNSFTAEEHSAIQKEAKNLILKKTQESDLLQKAQDQKKVYIDMLSLAIKSMGWKFIVKNDIKLKE
ncbi:MAG: DUF4230 domain-containing protein [Saprospiraceae bacterium]|nr:DUF4230 domain-containing protein [Saprospiraceae bacterium]MBK6564517.1 DUF4230 domain-containing protein [Saprospiraceae bacterium]MBK8371852.1 DUF4230 domain-containing protein [Saprospiraceae bacterium]MBK8547117.1 DUF4230 domain-containing protein [Saprospiraceae bacterium]MBK8853291.1 DUF4230 domain-containing protein [Saprospiraceae bacterium]